MSQLNTAPLRVGTGLRSHLVPFHRTTKARVVPPTVELPAAAQRSAVAHDTAASRERVAPAGFGLVTIDQVEPFQRSMNAVPADSPTAKQLVADVHETPFSCAPVAPPGFGLATIDQLVPFQRSARVRWVIPGPAK